MNETAQPLNHSTTQPPSHPATQLSEKKDKVPYQIDELLVADGGPARLAGLDLQHVQSVGVHLGANLRVAQQVGKVLDEDLASAVRVILKQAVVRSAGGHSVQSLQLRTCSCQ